MPLFIRSLLLLTALLIVIPCTADQRYRVGQTFEFTRDSLEIFPAGPDGTAALQPGGAGLITSWRAGWANLGPHESLVTGWQQTLPALGSLGGDNRFTLTGTDVTPPPWNQPPSLPSGTEDADPVMLTGTAP